MLHFYPYTCKSYYLNTQCHIFRALLEIWRVASLCTRANQSVTLSHRVSSFSSISQSRPWPSFVAESILDKATNWWSLLTASIAAQIKRTQREPNLLYGGAKKVTRLNERTGGLGEDARRGIRKPCVSDGWKKKKERTNRGRDVGVEVGSERTRAKFKQYSWPISARAASFDVMWPYKKIVEAWNTSDIWKERSRYNEARLPGEILLPRTFRNSWQIINISYLRFLSSLIVLSYFVTDPRFIMASEVMDSGVLKGDRRREGNGDHVAAKGIHIGREEVTN